MLIFACFSRIGSLRKVMIERLLPRRIRLTRSSGRVSFDFESLHKWMLMISRERRFI